MVCTGVVPDSSLKDLLGDTINSGNHRHVFYYKDDSKYVIKVSQGNNNMPNKLEWDIWQEIKTTDIAPLFAECKAISQTGRYLVMEFLDDLTEADKSKANVDSCVKRPTWWTDRKPDAFGKRIDGSIRIRDYGLVTFKGSPSGNELADCDKYPLQPYCFPSKAEVSEMDRLKKIFD